MECNLNNLQFPSSTHLKVLPVPIHTTQKTHNYPITLPFPYLIHFCVPRYPSHISNLEVNRGRWLLIIRLYPNGQAVCGVFTDVDHNTTSPQHNTTQHNAQLPTLPSLRCTGYLGRYTMNLTTAEIQIGCLFRLQEDIILEETIRILRSPLYLSEANQTMS